jgi:hypothetical protein
MVRALVKLLVPIATADLAMALHSLAFASAYRGNFEQGMQPFITT